VLALAAAAPSVPHVALDAKVVDAQEAIINHANNVQSLWTAGANKKWADHTYSNVAHMCGVKKGGPKLPRRPLTEAEKTMAIPTSFDPRATWGSTCPSLLEVRDQASCGSCWAFGAVESMTDRVCIASNGTTQVHFSAEDMNSCCLSCGDGCGGGYPEAAWSYWQNQGVVDGGNYKTTNPPPGCSPYTIASCDHHLAHPKIAPCGAEGPTPACVKTCDNGAGWTASKHHGQAPYSLDMSTIYQELMTHGPVESSFTVYADFPSYTGGVYVQTSDQELGGHAIKVMGWGVLNGVDYWIVANSWNPDWGVDGFFYIRRGTDECGIEDGFVAGLPKL